MPIGLTRIRLEAIYDLPFTAAIVQGLDEDGCLSSNFSSHDSHSFFFPSIGPEFRFEKIFLPLTLACCDPFTCVHLPVDKYSLYDHRYGSIV